MSSKSPMGYQTMGPSTVGDVVENKSLRNVYFSFAFIACGGLLFGYIIGVNSNMVTTGQLLCYQSSSVAKGSYFSWDYNQCWDLGLWGQGLMSSLNLIGATISSIFCFKYADVMGRRFEVRLGAALYFLGGLVAALSPALIGVVIGFFIYGLGIGFAMHAAPVYIAEISPAEVRGTLVSAKEAVIVVGMFLGFLMGFIFSWMEPYGWRFMIGVSCLVAALMEVGMAFVPRSPRWLVVKSIRSGVDGQAILGEAQEALQFFRKASTPDAVKKELDSILKDASMTVSVQTASVTDTFRYPRPLIVGCGLVFLQQVSGQPAVLYYATNIFKSAGFGATAGLSSVAVGLIKLIATLFSVWRVDLYGRRFLLFVGISMMTAALVVLAVAFHYEVCAEPGVSVANCSEDRLGLIGGWGYVTVAALGLYVSGYQVSFGPIAWLMISEIFPLNVRGSAISVAAVVNFCSNILMTYCQASVMSTLTVSGTFFLYFGICLLSLLFVNTVVPETRGLSLEQIEAQMTAKSTALL